MKGNLQYLLIWVAVWLCSATTVSAQLFIDNSYSAEQMVMDFFDSDLITISNVALQGNDVSLAYFEAANTELGIPAGILLTTGVVFDAIGPNNSESISTNFGLPGSFLLDQFGPGAPTFDGIVLAFDFVSEVEQLDFRYIFGSEEYKEFVGSAFNDIFAFVVTGPNIPGIQNIAMVPGAEIPVSINNVNHQFNSEFFQPNEPGGPLFLDFQYDGFTENLPAPFTVVPFETYHVEIAIADVGDAIYDSGVFLGVESLMGNPNLRPPAEIAFEQEGSVVDFDNLSRYATSYLWDFGDNTTSTERYPGTHYYAETGDYTVTLITENYCCNDTTAIQITVDEITSTEEIVEKPYTLFPNPVKGQLNIQWPDGTPYIATLYDLAGRSLWTVKQSGDIRQDLTALEGGVYWLHLQTDQEVFTEKIIKK